MSDAREAALYAELDRLGIAHRTVEHAPTFTVAESRAVKADMPGGHAKTLLMQDKRALFLLVALGEVRVDMKGVGAALGARGRLSFASAETLLDTLGVTPGTVTPFALTAEGAGAIERVVLDTALLAHDPLWFHPLRNTASTAIDAEGLRRFCSAHARGGVELDLSAPIAAKRG